MFRSRRRGATPRHTAPRAASFPGAVRTSAARRRSPRSTGSRPRAVLAPTRSSSRCPGPATTATRAWNGSRSAGRAIQPGRCSSPIGTRIPGSSRSTTWSRPSRLSTAENGRRSRRSKSSTSTAAARAGSVSARRRARDEGARGPDARRRSSSSSRSSGSSAASPLLVRVPRCSQLRSRLAAALALERRSR